MCATALGMNGSPLIWNGNGPLSPCKTPLTISHWPGRSVKSGGRTAMSSTPGTLTSVREKPFRSDPGSRTSDLMAYLPAGNDSVP